MIATIPSSTLLGIDGEPVAVEVHVSSGLPGFTVVGLPDAACRESRDRVRAAWISSGPKWPQQRMTVNLAPSSVRKGGAGVDLAIAVGLLVAVDALPAEAVAGCAFLGELGLDGSVRRVPGIVPLVDALDDAVVVVPRSCVREAMLVARHGVRGVDSLGELVAALRGEAPWPDAPPERTARRPRAHPDLADVRGSSVRPGRARPCWPGACPGCRRRSSATTPCRPPASVRPRACRCRRACSSPRCRSARRTTAPRWCR